jgi:hypothetical protein
MVTIPHFRVKKDFSNFVKEFDFMSGHKFNSGGYCEYCGQETIFLNERRGHDGKLPSCPDAPKSTPAGKFITKSHSISLNKI